MRTLFAATAFASLAACNNSPPELKDPPVLQVTSPQRSLIQDHAGAVMVTGTVTPAPGTTVAKVMVNDVAAMVNTDGTFTAVVQIEPGATLLHTIATDKDGGTASDTRSVEAGELRKPGANIDNAIAADISAPAFAKISDVASTMIMQTDFKTLLAPLQPMVHSGDENGEDCLFARLYVDDLHITGAKLALTPVDGGISFYAEVDGLNVPGHMRYAVACLGGQDTTLITADKAVISGTLLVTPNGMNGFTTTLANPNIQLLNLDMSSSGVPGAILSILPLDKAIEYIAPKAAEMFMGPMMNKALGSLAGPQKLNVLGKTIDLQVSASDVTFTKNDGLVVLNTSVLIEGAENSKGYIFTDNGMPAMDPGMGLQFGLADDLANEMLSQFVALGGLNITMPATGGTFDATSIALTSPPMISASPTDGKMVLVLPDMVATFTLQGAIVGKAAINASISLDITPAGSGYAIALQLGKPDISVDVLDDVANQTRFSDEDLSKAVKLATDGQITSISTLLGSIPLPAVAGIQLHNLSVGAAQGYVMVKGEIQ